MTNYSPKFWNNLGYIQQKLRAHNELFSFELLRECIDEIRNERTLAQERESPNFRNSPLAGSGDCGSMDLCADSLGSGELAAGES